MMVHTDKKHFRCCACPAQFKGRENLRKHVAKFHQHLLQSVDRDKISADSNNTGNDRTTDCKEQKDTSVDNNKTSG